MTDEDEDDGSGSSRQYAAAALKRLAEIADDPRADAQTRNDAHRELEKWLLRLKEIENDPNTSARLRRDLEATKRRFLNS
jgi:hypothetical protein